MLLTPPTNAVGGPSETPSKKNSTVPVAVLGVTVAVKVMFSLSQLGLLFEVTVVVVAVCAFNCRWQNENNTNTIKPANLRDARVAILSVRGIYSSGCLLIDALVYYAGPYNIFYKSAHS